MDKVNITISRSVFQEILLVSKRISVSSRVVNCDITDGKSLSSVDREDLNWTVENVQSSDGRCPSQAMGIEELWLGLSAIGSLSIPPSCTVSVERIAF